MELQNDAEWVIWCKAKPKDKASDEALPLETVAHLQSAGCRAQKKSVIGAHNSAGGI